MNLLAIFLEVGMQEIASSPDWDFQFTPKQSQYLDTGELKQAHGEEQLRDHRVLRKNQHN